MSIPFPELAAIRLGTGLSPRLPPPRAASAVLADAHAAAALPAHVTTADAQTAHAEFNRLGRERNEARRAAPDKKAPEAFEMAVADYRRALVGVSQGYLLHRLTQAATAPVGFGERLVQFWADHFTVRAQNPGLHPMAVAFVEEAIRPHIMGRFGAMLKAAETHPAMLTFLDQQRSIGPRSLAAVRARRPLGLNENLAREILELHTLGVGADYSQQDVRSFANLLTGLNYAAGEKRRFFPARAEPGPDIVLGESYGGTRPPKLDHILEALDDLAVRPETARHLASKLAAHFVSDAPEPGLVDALAAEWSDSRGDLGRVCEVLVAHPALARQFRQKVRQPFDLMAASLRALDIVPGRVTALARRPRQRLFLGPLDRMGQPWFGASGPDGWPEEAAAWIRPQLMAERIDWVMNVPQNLLPALPDPRSFLDAALGGTAGEGLAWAVPKAESIREGVGLVLASAEFNRR